MKNKLEKAFGNLILVNVTPIISGELCFESSYIVFDKSVEENWEYEVINQLAEMLDVDTSVLDFEQNGEFVELDGLSISNLLEQASNIIAQDVPNGNDLLNLTRAWRLVNDKYPENNSEIQLIRWAILKALTEETNKTESENGDEFIAEFTYLDSHKKVKVAIDEDFEMTLFGHMKYHPITGKKIKWIEKK